MKGGLKGDASVVLDAPPKPKKAVPHKGWRIQMSPRHANHCSREQRKFRGVLALEIKELRRLREHLITSTGHSIRPEV